MPTLDYLINDAKIPGDADDMDFDEDEEMTGDNWIMVDATPKKLEFNPVVMEDKIKRETESMRSTPSQMILSGKKNSPKENISLEDFIIKKVIDKGSFGKVFLV